MLKREARKRRMVRGLTWISDKAQALCWVGLSAFIIFKTNFFRQLWENELISSLFMNLTLVCLGLNLTIMVYVTLIMPLKGMEADIEKVPKLVPIMTLASVLLPLFLTLAIWPVWGFLSPIYIFILSFGFIFTLTFLPDGKCGTLIFWIGAIFLCTLSHMIPHAGHEHSW